MRKLKGKIINQEFQKSVTDARVAQNGFEVKEPADKHKQYDHSANHREHDRFKKSGKKRRETNDYVMLQKRLERDQ